MFRNATHAFYDGLAETLREGAVVTVRGNEVRELRPHVIRLERPTERVYVVRERNNNIFACIAETLWVMAGRSDIAFLSHYLPRAADFSDDGLVWRAGYGPRLRNWQGVDQFREVARLLREDPNSRRAVSVLYDPARDFVSSEDIPCNNWLQFLIRDERLHMHIGVRSNDAVWGFSGVNTFEWSVLQQMMAYWTDASVGEAVYFISSFHLYQRHYARAERILGAMKGRTLYEFGIASAPFSTPLEEFDALLSLCFRLEAAMRGGDDVGAEVARVPDEFLRNCLQMLDIYNRHLRGDTLEALAPYLEALPTNDFKVAAIEHFTRVPESRRLVALNAAERSFFDYFWAESHPASGLGAACSLERVFDVLATLHHKKTLVYGDAWKKRGEVVGVFSNIARKYDRLEAVYGKGITPTLDETLADTLADLCVYAVKYLTYLAEHYPGLFRDFAAGHDVAADAEACAHNLDGFQAVAEVLLARYGQDLQGWGAVRERAESYGRITHCFRALEQMLTGPAPQSADPAKCVAAADLALAAAHFLLLSCLQEPSEFERFVSGVNAI